MSKILKNNTGSIVPIPDTGFEVPASGQLLIQPENDKLFAGSDDTVTLIGDGTLTVNDGTQDLSISDGVDLIKGIFPVLPDVYPVKSDAENDLTIDMTSRQKTANAEQLLANLFNYGLNKLAWSESLTGGATIVAAGPTQPNFLRMNLTGASGDTAEIRTKRYLRYQPFREHELNFSCVFGADVANRVIKVGQFDNDNGWFFQKSGSTLSIVTRTNLSGSPVDTPIDRASWNFDRLDGSGSPITNPSGLNIDLNNIITFYIRYVWHGANGIEFGVEYFNKKVPVHRIIFSGSSTTPFSKTSLLPLGVKVENTGATSASTFLMGPTSFDVHGGETNELGYNWAYGMQPSDFKSVASGGFVNLLAVRNLANFNSLVNRGVIQPQNFEIYASTAMFYEVYIDTVIAGGAWSPVNANSLAEVNIGAFGFTGGRRIDAGYVPAGGSGASARAANANTSFPFDVFVANDSLLSQQDAIVIRAIAVGTTGNVGAKMGWKEVY